MRHRVYADGCPARSRLRTLSLRRSARRYASHEWGVLPGACLVGTRFTCGVGCRTVAVHPAREPWSDYVTTNSAEISEVWAERPYAVLLATGEVFDVLDVPAYIGMPAARAIRGPVAVTPLGRYMFLVQPGAELRSELAQQHSVVLHGRQSWIPAPPTRTPHGAVRWTGTPQQAEWELPESPRVQDALVATIPGGVAYREARRTA
jgi:Bifunctional DNA primase/polymerase, N-terminal